MSSDELAHESCTDAEADFPILSEGGYRVVLSNRGSKCKTNPCFKVNAGKETVNCEVCGKPTKSLKSLHTKCEEGYKHTKDWIGILEPCNITPSHGFYIGLLLNWARNEGAADFKNGFVYSSIPTEMGYDLERIRIVDGFIADLLHELVGRVPDASELERARCNGEGQSGLEGILSPSEVAIVAMEMVERHYPEAKYSATTLKGRYREVDLNNIPLRVVAALLFIAFACEETNRGDLFWANRFGQKSTQWGAMMSFRLYLAMRYSNLPYDRYVGSAQM